MKREVEIPLFIMIILFCLLLLYITIDIYQGATFSKKKKNLFSARIVSPLQAMLPSLCIVTLHWEAVPTAARMRWGRYIQCES